MGFKLRLCEVHAKKETTTSVFGGWGTDDIYIGGAGIEFRGEVNPFVHKIKPFKVGEFDSGDRKTYGPPRELADFGLGSKVFPKEILASIFIVERDGGGDLNKFYADLCNGYEELSNFAKADLATGDFGSRVSDNMKFLIYAKKAWEIANAVYNKWKGDELFKPQDIHASINSEQHRWNGKRVSQKETLEFRGHGGKYLVKYDWAAPI